MTSSRYSLQQEENQKAVTRTLNGGSIAVHAPWAESNGCIEIDQLLVFEMVVEVQPATKRQNGIQTLQRQGERESHPFTSPCQRPKSFLGSNGFLASGHANKVKRVRIKQVTFVRANLAFGSSFRVQACVLSAGL